MNSKDMIDYMKSRNFKMFVAEYIGESTEIELGEEIEVFLEIAKDLEVKHIFYNVDSLTENDIERSIITDEMLLEARIPESFLFKLREDIEKFNKSLLILKDRVGEERRVEFFYVFQGTLYTYKKEDVELYPSHPRLLIEYILENYEEEIDEFKEKERLAKQNNIQKLLASMEQQIIDHQNFKVCTNETNRRKFAFEIYSDTEDIFVANDISYYQLLEHINFLWSKHKDSFRKR